MVTVTVQFVYIGGREESAIILSFVYIYVFFVAVQACYHLVDVI